jgi:uncharacterized membrane protein YedE/YeeE
MKIVVAALLGLLFGAGLLLSGMTDPARVIGFLDVTGAWNPALALVMGAAVIVAAPAFAFVRRTGTSVLGEPVRLPGRFNITPALVLGAAIFGVGWGLVGLCPGPSLVVLPLAPIHAGVFVGALIIGLRIGDWVIATDPSDTTILHGAEDIIV